MKPLGPGVGAVLLSGKVAIASRGEICILAESSSSELVFESRLSQLHFAQHVPEKFVVLRVKKSLSVAWIDSSGHVILDGRDLTSFLRDEKIPVSDAAAGQLCICNRSGGDLLIVFRDILGVVNILFCSGDRTKLATVASSDAVSSVALKIGSFSSIDLKWIGSDGALHKHTI